MRSILLSIFLCMSLCLICGGEIIDYCQLVVDGFVHSACNNTCALKEDNYKIDPDFEFRRDILDGHNFFRNYFAGGGNTSGGNSQASNMMVLSYDMGLEFTVACWIYSHGLMEHDISHGTPKFKQAGQNLWEGNKKAGDPTTKEGIMHLLWRWYRELQWTKAKWIDAYPQRSERHEVWTAEGVGPFQIGHFTQLVWAESTHVGCARCYRENLRKFLVGCNYGPSGNFVGEAVYKRGSPASECPSGKTANKIYPNLCGEIEPWPEGADYVGIPEMDERWDKLYKEHSERPELQTTSLAPPWEQDYLETKRQKMTKKPDESTRLIELKGRRSVCTREKAMDVVIYLCLYSNILSAYSIL